MFSNLNLQQLIFGRLSLEAIPYHEPILVATFVAVALGGFADAVMLVTQKALSVGASEGYLPPHHYDQVFTAHGTIMIFFMAMPFVTGVMNYIMPLQIGARDVAFPFLNNFSFWMTTGGAVLTMLSLFLGEFGRTGRLRYPPLSRPAS